MSVRHGREKKSLPPKNNLTLKFFLRIEHKDEGDEKKTQNYFSYTIFFWRGVWQKRKYTHTHTNISVVNGGRRWFEKKLLTLKIEREKKKVPFHLFWFWRLTHTHIKLYIYIYMREHIRQALENSVYLFWLKFTQGTFVYWGGKMISKSKSCVGRNFPPHPALPSLTFWIAHWFVRSFFFCMWSWIYVCMRTCEWERVCVSDVLYAQSIVQPWHSKGKIRWHPNYYIV